jgi:hypothetical protein
LTRVEPDGVEKLGSEGAHRSICLSGDRSVALLRVAETVRIGVV